MTKEHKRNISEGIKRAAKRRRELTEKVTFRPAPAPVPILTETPEEILHSELSLRESLIVAVIHKYVTAFLFLLEKGK